MLLDLNLSHSSICYKEENPSERNILETFYDDNLYLKVDV